MKNPHVLHQPKNGVLRRHAQRSDNGVQVSLFCRPLPGWRSHHAHRERNLLQAMLRRAEETARRSVAPWGQNGMGLLIPRPAVDAEEPMEVGPPQYAPPPSRVPCGVWGMGLLIPHLAVDPVVPMEGVVMPRHARHGQSDGRHSCHHQTGSFGSHSSSHCSDYNSRHRHYHRSDGHGSHSSSHRSSSCGRHSHGHRSDGHWSHSSSHHSDRSLRHRHDHRSDSHGRHSSSHRSGHDSRHRHYHQSDGHGSHSSSHRSRSCGRHSHGHR